MIIFLQALYNQNAYIYRYVSIRHPKVFRSSPHIPTTISVYHSLVSTFLPVTSRNDSDILVSIKSKKDVPISIVSH